MIKRTRKKNPELQPLKDDWRDKGVKFSIGSNGILDKTNPKFDGFSFDESEGRERVIFVASTARLSFLNNPGTLKDEFVNKVLALLEINNSPSGLQTTVEQLGKEYFVAGSAKVGDDGSSYLKDSVYLSLVYLDHSKPAH